MARRKKTNNSNFLLLIIILLIAYVIYQNYALKPHPGISIDYNDSFKTNFKDLNIYFCPDMNCEDILYKLVTDSNDFNCAVYEINLPWFYNIVKKKLDSNHHVFLIMDDKQFNKVYKNFKDKNLLDYLIDKNVIHVDLSEKDYMHNKFCVFDNNLILLGSFNFTENAVKYNNNNFVVFRSNIANLVRDEFNEMYLNIFNGGEKTPLQDGNLQVYFCPEDDCAGKYAKLFKDANKTINCMFFAFTYDQLGDLLIKKHESGVDVKIIFESSQISKYSEYKKLKDAGIVIIKDKNPKIMHNKFCIIDNKIVITGSMNPSNHSQYANDESILIIKNSGVAEQYTFYFNKYFTKWRD